MFERKKLARLWREAHDFCLLIRVASERGLLGESSSESGRATALFWIAELCEPLMIMYAQNLPSASSLRQNGITRQPALRFEADIHRTHCRLLRSMRAWMSIASEKRSRTLQRVLGMRSMIHAEELSSLARELTSCHVPPSAVTGDKSGFNQWASNSQAAKQHFEAETLIKEGIAFYDMVSDYLMRGPLELGGEFFRESVRRWIVAVANEKEAMVNRPSPNMALAQTCDMVDTVLRSTHALGEEEAKMLIRNLASDLKRAGTLLEQELRRAYSTAA